MPKKNSNKGKRKNKARTTGTRQATVEPPVPPNLAEDVATVNNDNPVVANTLSLCPLRSPKSHLRTMPPC